MTERDSNPYSAPTESDGGDFVRKTKRRRYVLASPAQRLGGHFVDGLLVFGGALVFLPANAFVLFLPTNASFLFSRASGQSPYLPLFIFWACAAGVQWFLIASRGQTIGKILMKTKIVRLGGSSPGFYRGVLLRSCLGYLPLALPVAGSIYALLDALLVFRRDRRTVRDLVAGTRVIRI